MPQTWSRKQLGKRIPFVLRRKTQNQWESGLQKSDPEPNRNQFLNTTLMETPFTPTLYLQTHREGLNTSNNAMVSLSGDSSRTEDINLKPNRGWRFITLVLSDARVLSETECAALVRFNQLFDRSDQIRLTTLRGYLTKAYHIKPQSKTLSLNGVKYN